MAQSQGLHRPPGPLWSQTPRRAGAHSAGRMDSPAGFSSPCAADARVELYFSLIETRMTGGDFALLHIPASPHPG